jgi:hypothetical protein
MKYIRSRSLYQEAVCSIRNPRTHYAAVTGTHLTKVCIINGHRLKGRTIYSQGRKVINCVSHQCQWKAVEKNLVNYLWFWLSISSPPPLGCENFSLHRVQSGSGAHPASYPMGTRGSFLRGKAGSEADHSPPSSAEVKEWMELYHHSPNTPSWRGAQLKHRDNFNFLPFTTTW